MRVPAARGGLTLSRVARAYRREARSAVQVMPWLGGLTDAQRDWFRSHGRQLAEQLIVYLDAADGDDAAESLRQASEDAAGYGRKAAELGLSLSQAVEGFLQFRRPFLHQLVVSSSSRGLDAEATTKLIDKTEGAMDRLLMSAMAGHEVRRAKASYGRQRLGKGAHGDISDS